MSLTVLACAPDSRKEKPPRDLYCEQQVAPNQFVAVYKDGSYKIISGKDAKEKIEQDESVLWYEPSYRIASVLTDPLERPEEPPLDFTRSADNSSLWKKMGFQRFYSAGFYGQNVRVAVVDTGVNLSSPYLRGRWVVNEKEIPNNGIDDDMNGFVDDYIGWNFQMKSPLQLDEPNHGTQIAHLIAASANSPAGQGVAPQARILPLDFMDERGGTEVAAIQAIDYAISQNVQVINNSWTLVCSYLLRDRYRDWSRKNVLLINASGNDRMFLAAHSQSSSNYLAPNYLSIGSLNNDHQRAHFSNHGPNVLLYAFGVDLVTTGRFWLPFDSPTVLSSGTSYSAGIISGAAALIWSQLPELTASQVRQELLRRTRNVNGMSLIQL